MSHTVCHDIGNWVNENVQQQVEQCVEQDCDWWCLCCNKWLCALVWVVVTIVTWVVTTVCEVVTDIIDIVVGLVVGLWDIVAGIFTLDWSRILGGLAEILGPIVSLIGLVISIATLGSLVGAFYDTAKTWQLRDFVRDLLTKEYGKDKDLLASIMDSLGIDSGGFGFRLYGRALRTYIRSDFSSTNDGTPDLISWVKNGLDLKALAGFNSDLWWNSSWPELVGDSGDISEEDLDNYITKNGKGDDVKQFTLFCMETSDLQTRLDTALKHGTDLGLMFQWNIEQVRLTQSNEVLVNADNFASILKQPPFSRHNNDHNASEAKNELCVPTVIGVFGFTDSAKMGQSAHLAPSVCLEVQSDGTKQFRPEGITGASFRDRRPDIGFKYTAIHELGHTFGLCHVDGLFRIMFTSAAGEGKSVWSWSSLWQFWTSGVEAGFTLEEAKKVWEYIVANFSADCLKTRGF